MADLFDGVNDPHAIRPRDPNAPAASAKRLSRQCSDILAMLRRGRVTNTRMVGVSFKYTSRTSDLRKAGYDVRCVDHNPATGETLYALFEGGREVGSEGRG